MRGHRCLPDLQSIYKVGLKRKNTSDLTNRASANIKTSTLFTLPTCPTSPMSNDRKGTITYGGKNVSNSPISFSFSTVETVSYDDDDMIGNDLFREHQHNYIMKTTSTAVQVPLDTNASMITVPTLEPQIEPKDSFHRRILPVSLTQFSSPEGRELFQNSLASQNAEAYFPLAEQFLNQSDPAFCGITSLVMVLNAMGVDPNVRWKGGWRWYGSEDMIFNSCCISPDKVKKQGISMEEFRELGRCQGLNIELKRAVPQYESYYEAGVDLEIIEDEEEDLYYTVEDFRSDIINMARNPPMFEVDEESSQSLGGFMVVSFDRSSLGQTGEGHFSPIAAYHEGTDQCLVLDVARFKYAPYWVPVIDLYQATRGKDRVTNKSRGWFKMYSNAHIHNGSRITEGRESSRSEYRGLKATSEAKRPAKTVPLSGRDAHSCPVGEVKIQYCSVGKLPPNSKRKTQCAVRSFSH